MTDGLKGGQGREVDELESDAAFLTLLAGVALLGSLLWLILDWAGWA